MDEMMDILRAGRVLAGLSQDELGEAAGLSRQIVVRIEGHQHNVTIGAIVAVQTALTNAGVVFIPSTPTRGPGVALKKGFQKERPAPTLASPLEEKNNDHESAGNDQCSNLCMSSNPSSTKET